jgi:hypothetical protein
MTRKLTSRKAAFSKRIFLSGILLCAVVLCAGFVCSQRAAAVSNPTPVIIATAADNCNKGGFFGLEPWYHFIPDSEIGVKKTGEAPVDSCGIKCFNIFVQTNPNDCNQTASDIPGVILAVIDDLLRIAGLVAVAFILKGSFDYVGSRGNAEKTASAQSTIISALTGLAIALVAVALVSYIGGQLIG